ncbi:MAG: fibronectin type III domain-containing protein [bacterium]
MKETQKGWQKIFKGAGCIIILIVMAFFLCSCIGSDGDDENNQGAITETVKLSGLVASGAPLQRTFVTFRDGEGNRYTDITDTDGKYVNVDITAHGLTVPVLIRVQDPTTGIMYSYASRNGTANVHPLTDPIIRAWFRTKYPTRDLDQDFYDDTATFSLPTQAEIDFIKSVIMDVMKSLLTAIAASTEGLKDADGNTVEVEDFDPMETPINADGTGFDRILEETDIGTSEESGNLNIVVDEGSTLETDLESSGGATTITIDTDTIDETDTTPPAQPNAPVALQVSNTQILITWSLSDGQAASDIAYYIIYQNGTEKGSATSTSFIIPGLEAGGSYSYTLKAYDGAGNASEMSAASNTITIATITDTGAPTAGSVSAQALGFNEIELTWSEFSDDRGIVSYKIYSCQDDQGTNPTIVAKVMGQPFIHFNLTAQTTYYYIVKAVDAAGNVSNASNVASAVTGAAPLTVDATPPAAPTNFSATASSYSQIDLTWTAPADTDLAGYFIYRGINVIVMLDSDATSYSDTSLMGNTTYNYWIKAFDLKANLSDITITSATTPEATDTTAPSTPSNVTATADSATQITISWTASTDNDSGVAGYYVYRDGDQVADITTGTSCEDTSLTPETTYSYQISAYDNAGNESVKSTAQSATTPAGALPDVSTLIAEAKALLEAQNIPGAKVKFQAAFDLNPTNKDANFGLAITEGIMLLNNSDIANFFDAYETYKPTIDNVIYGILDSTYEVWGGSTLLCDSDALDPNANGYTKLSSSQSPATSFSGYDYYVIYTSPFSEIDITVSGTNIMIYCDNEAEITAWSTDSFSATIGGQTLFGASLSLSAPQGMTMSVGETSQARAVVKRPRSKVPATLQNDNNQSIMKDELASLLHKFPKNKRSPLSRLRRAARSLAEGPPTISDMQSLINSAFLPTINSMIPKLRAVEGSDPPYEFTITPAMTGGAETQNTILDDGEFYALDGMLCILKGVMNFITAYNLDVDYDIIEYDPLSQINNSTFFTLKSDGATRMERALTAFQDAADKAELAYTFIFNEWGYIEAGFTDIQSNECQILVPQNTVTDNGLRLHSDYDAYELCDCGGSYDFLAEDDENIRNALNAVQIVLAGQVTYTEEVVSNVEKEYITNGTDTVTFYSETTTDPDEVRFTVTGNLTNFFTNPLNRTDLPTLAYDLTLDTAASQAANEPIHVYAGPDGVIGTSDDQEVECNVAITSDLPDNTLNGIFPLPQGIPEFDGIVYLESTVVLHPDTWPGVNQSVASDGTSIYLYKQDDWGSSGAKIWIINPSTGGITTTYVLSLNSQPNGIVWINDMTWHNGALWATGYYADAGGATNYGVFQVDLANSQSAQQIPASSGIYQVYGIASNGASYLYVEVTVEGGNTGIVRFTTSDSSIPSSLFFGLDDISWQIFYGGGYLWFDEAEEKVDPANGSIVMEYLTQGWTNVYLNNTLYSVDAEDDMRIYVLTEP